MKKVLYLVLALTLLFTLSCQSVERVRVHEPTGRIVIYTSMYGYVVENVWRDLQVEFPDYAIEFVYGGTGVIQERIRIEQAGGRLGADILMVAEPAYSLELKEKGMLHPFRSRHASNLAFDFDPDGYWYPVRVSNMVLAYNPQRHNRNMIPNSFFDFANDASARREISMRNPLVSGTTLATIAALRDRHGNAFFDALGNQQVIIDYGSEAGLRRLETGECRVVMVLEESILRAREEDNSILQIIYPTDGVVVIPSNIMIINDRWNANRNTQTAEAIADWFLSANGQNAIVDAWMHSVRTDFRRRPQGSLPINQILDNSMPVNWENVFQQRQEILRAFETSIAARRE